MQGHVGVYWRGGKLLNRISPPGIHMRIPLLDTYEAIQITMQTDKVMDILCGTKGGVNIFFGKIEVGPMESPSAYALAPLAVCAPGRVCGQTAKHACL